MSMTPSAASDTKISDLPAAPGSMKLALATGACEIRAMVGASKLLSARPPGPPGENVPGELPPEQPPSIASVADAPSAARITRKIAIKLAYHFCSPWSAPRKVSVVQLVKHSRSTRFENEASAEETKVLRVASNEILALE